MRVHINSLLLLDKNKWTCFSVYVNLFAKLYDCFYIAITEKAGAMLLKAICCSSSTEEFRHLNLRFACDSNVGICKSLHHSYSNLVLLILSR